MSPRAKTQGISGLALQIVQRSAAEGRETGSEDEPRVGEVGTGDDALGDRRLSFPEVGCDQLLGEFGRNAARGAFARLAVPPDVEAAAGFLTEISRGDELGELFRRLGAFTRQFLPHRETDVQAHRVGQLDRPHRHAERRDRRVERLRRDAFVHHAQRLVDVGTEHAIDEKARRILDRQGQFIDLPHERSRPLRDLRIGGRAPDHFDQLQLRNGVEEMDSHQARRIPEFRADVGELETRRVRGEESFRLCLHFELREQFALGLQVLENRLDDDVRPPRSVPGDVGNQAVERVPNSGFFAQPAFEKLGRALHRRREALGRLVLQRHGQAAHRAPGGDVSAHDASADHVNVFRLEVAVLPERLQALLEEEDADEIARRVALQKPDDGSRILGSRCEWIAIVSPPQLEDRVRRRIVIRRGPGGKLLPRQVNDERTHQGGIHQPLNERQPSRAGRLEHHDARGVLLDARRHRLVHEAHTLRAARIHGPAREQHVERGSRADEARQALDAAPARKDAEHHFRKREACSGLIYRDAIAAGERELDAPAHAETVYERKRREGQGFEFVIEIPAALDQAHRVVRVLDLGELLDVGARDESGDIAGTDDKPSGILGTELIEYPVELRHHVGGQDVRGGALLVERQPDDVVVGGLELPVLVFARHDDYSASTSIAPPRPPPIQIEAMPRLPLARLSACSKCSTMRAPEAPTGCPSAMAPPSTLSFALSSSPIAPSRPSSSRQYLSSSHAARQASTWAANASLISQASRSLSLSLWRLSIGVAACTGPRPICAGSRPAHCESTMRPSGFRSWRFTASSVASTSHAAPSVICEEFPAVTLPYFRSKKGFSFARFSAVESLRTPSSSW